MLTNHHVSCFSRKLASASWSLLALASIGGAAHGHHVIFHAKGGDPPLPTPSPTTTTITTITTIIIIIVIIVIVLSIVLVLVIIIIIVIQLHFIIIGNYCHYHEASVSSLESSCFSTYSGVPQGHHVIFPAKGPAPAPSPIYIIVI